ncbi:PAS domain S-box protein [Ornatilinea apprima]|uniref:PAS domain S-box protein n=1 Tax=Ornatilinea apprima TaxID=1134406 RepID=UPI000946129E|nr:HD domain-containing phosphohydrolase [Ornatilinea apprima]
MTLNLTRTLIQSIPNPAAITSPEGAVLLANEAFANLLNLPADQTGQCRVSFPASGPAQTISLHWQQQQRACLATVEEIEFNAQPAFWVKIAAQNDQPLSMVEISESNLVKGIFQTVELIILILDQSGSIVQFNPFFEQITGYTLEEVRGKNWFATFIPDWEHENVKKAFAKSFQNQSTRGNITPIKTRHGQLRLVEWYDQPLKNTSEHTQAILAIGIDITQQLQTERALRQNEELFFQLTDNINDVFWIRDYDTREILYVSPAYEPVFGRSCDSLYENRNDIFNDVHPDDQERVQRIASRQYQHGEFFNDQFRILRPDGSQRWLHLRSFFVVDGEQKPIRVVGVAEDITDQREAAERIERQVQQLAALRQIDISITSSPDLNKTLQVLIEQVIANLDVDAADVLLLDRDTGQLRYIYGRGFTSQLVDSAHIRLGKDFAERAVIEKRLIKINHLQEKITSLSMAPVVAAEQFVAYYCMPLISKGDVKGVLEVWNRTPLNGNPEWVAFLEALAGQAAIAVDNASLFNDLRQVNTYLTRAYDATIEGWARALELRDVETEGHSRRVTELTLQMAREMGFGGDELEHIRRGALLHDVGKMGIPDSILLKPGPLTPQEWEIMRKHPIYAYESLLPIEFLHPALSIPLYHHEKWNGSGYPHGLSGEEIPLEARIFAVIDVWDALRSHRPYRSAWNMERTLDYIQGESGRHFDPTVVKALAQMVEKDRQAALESSL